MTIRVITLGCKVNQCESASIVAALKSRNLYASEGLGPADVYILNTCSVTSEADKKSRQYITKMCKLNPDCNIIVVGCSSQNNKHQFVRKNVIAVGGTICKIDFVTTAIEKLCIDNQYNTISDRIVFDKNIEKIGEFDQYCCEKYPIFDKTRSFIKIQDGCNRYCTYCIIPYLRGRSRSRSIDDIVNECKYIESREIVLTGIDLSYYGRDINGSFVELLRALSHIDKRKRLGSLECEVVDDELLKVMLDGNFCPHFHLSLQSGNTAVLKSMNRHYDTDYYYEKVELIRKYFPLAGITTDIIVGFPTETDDAFVDSVKFIEKCAFSDIHVFPYSNRTGTLASKKYKVLPPEIIKMRVQALLDVKKKLHQAFLNKNIGEVVPVYVEDREGDYNVGYTPNYIKVFTKAPQGIISDLLLSEPYDIGIIGLLPNNSK